MSSMSGVGAGRQAGGEAGPGSDTGLFTRQATGLVREMKPRDALLMSLAFISIPLGYFFFAQVPGTFPGANTALAFLLTGLIVTPAMAVYALFAAIMPRSGGDLVFVGRVIHPFVGFVNNFGFVVFQVCAGAFLMLFLPQFALPSMFQNIALTSGNQWWARAATNISTQTGQFLIAGIGIILLTALFCIGLKWVIRVFVPLMVAQFIGVAVTFLILLFSTHGAFQQHLRVLGFQNIVPVARKAGFTLHPYTTSATFQAVALLIAVPGLAFMWSYFGGEVRRPRAMAMSITLGGVIVSTIILALMVWQANRVFGTEFQQAANYLSTNKPSAYPLNAQPFINAYLGILTQSTFWVLVIGVTFAMGVLAAPFAAVILATRALFAYSFDRMLPSGLADVNMKYHTPIKATLLVGVIMLAFCAGFVFSASTFSDFIVASSIALFIVTGVTGLAGALLPYRRKDLYQLSPAKQKILGLPLITWLGSLAVVLYSIYLYVLIDKVGFHSRSYYFTAGVYVLGAVIAVVAYVRNRQAGISLNVALRELPPE